MFRTTCVYYTTIRFTYRHYRFYTRVYFGREVYAIKRTCGSPPRDKKGWKGGHRRSCRGPSVPGITTAFQIRYGIGCRPGSSSAGRLNNNRCPERAHFGRGGTIREKYSANAR